MGVSLVHCPERASKSSARSGVIPAEPRDSDNAERLTGRARIRDTQFLPSTWLDLCQPDEHTSRARPTLWLAMPSSRQSSAPRRHSLLQLSRPGSGAHCLPASLGFRLDLKAEEVSAVEVQ